MGQFETYLMNFGKFWIETFMVGLLPHIPTMPYSLSLKPIQIRKLPILDGKMKYAWIAWLIYSLVLVSKIATCFRIFHQDVSKNFNFPNIFQFSKDG